MGDEFLNMDYTDNNEAGEVQPVSATLAPAENGISGLPRAAEADGNGDATDIDRARSANGPEISSQGKEKVARPSHDFRKCELASLQKYIEHHGLTAKPDSSTAELAALVSQHFAKDQVDEDIVIHNFLNTGAYAANSLFKLDKKRKRVGGGGFRDAGYGNGSAFLQRKEMRFGSAMARVDEEVAVRPPREVSDDAAAGWILARVIKYVPDRDQYHVRDEDDHSNLMTVSSSNVIRLTEENIGDVKKDDTVLAVFPDTTSFYRAIITKLPKRLAPGPQEVHCKFDDDEDETGRTPHRRVPARYVLRLSQVGGRYESAEYSDGNNSRDGVPVGASRKAMRDYKAMISHALKKLPANKGTLKDILKIIETDFNDELSWKLEGEGKKTPVWKIQVRKILINPRSGFMFINSGEKALYSAAGGGGGYFEH